MTTHHSARGQAGIDPGSVQLTTGEGDQLLGAMQDGVVRQRQGRVVWANEGMGRLAERPVAELIGMDLSELLTDSDDRPLRELDSIEAAYVRDGSGRLRPVSLIRVSEEMLLLVDRGRERRLEEEIWRLSRTSTQSPDATEPLRGEVVGMVEHEIRTAVTVVRGYLRILLSEHHGPLNPDQWSFSREARRATDRVELMLDNLMSLAAGDEALPVVRKAVRLHEVLRTSIEGARPLLENAGIKVEYEFEAQEDALLADPDRLEQVFVNLVSNAAAHAPQGSSLVVHTSTGQVGDADFIAVAFADSGPGVSEEEVSRIFQPFVQGHGSPGVASGGVGLGLAICERIMDAHAGSIDAVPSLGYGLFRVTLPLGGENG